MTTNNYPLTQEEFKDWLLSKKSHELVGYQHSSCACPVFCCLRYQKEIRVTSVLNSYTTLVDGTDLVNPRWVSEFIGNIDSLSLDYGIVTAQDALEVL